MEKARKDLKVTSIVVLFCAALSLIRMVVEFIFRDKLIGELPEGMSETFLNIGFIVVFAIGIIVLIPQLYVGIKGVQVGNGAAVSKAYIVWAKILFVLSVLAVVSTALGFIGSSIQTTDITALVDSLIDSAIFYYIIKCAKAIEA